jgi:hypothetical protein
MAMEVSIMIHLTKIIYFLNIFAIQNNQNNLIYFFIVYNNIIYSNTIYFINIHSYYTFYKDFPNQILKKFFKAKKLRLLLD